MKILSRLALIVLSAGMLVPAVSAKTREPVLLVVPREDAPIRLGMDVGNRMPTLLLSYRLMPNDAVSLHGWSGSEWVNVTLKAYSEGSFFTTPPASALIVVEEGEDIPATLIPDESWCPEVYRIDTANIRPLLHLLGRHYDFQYEDWKWFSDNYRAPLESINPEGLNIAWYQRRLDQNLRGPDRDEGADLQYLSVLRSPQLDMQADDEMLDETAEEPLESDLPVEVEEMEPPLEDDPLTNAAPEAVIMGAGDAEETLDPTEDDEENGEQDELPAQG